MSQSVYSVDRGNCYLVIHELDGHRVSVRPTAHGRAVLDSFWVMWLRELLLGTTPRETDFGVEVFQDSVTVSSDASLVALVETIRSIAAAIRPLPHNGLHRVDEASRNLIRWRVSRAAGDAHMRAIEAVYLRPDYRANMGDADPGGVLHVQLHQGGILPHWQIARIVEMQVSLHMFGSLV